jgi:hypothetical protein
MKSTLCSDKSREHSYKEQMHIEWRETSKDLQKIKEVLSIQRAVT